MEKTVEMWVQSLGQKDALEKEMATQLQYSCLGNPMDRGAWLAKVHEVTKSQTQLSEWAHIQYDGTLKRIVDKEMAAHSSTLVWKIPWAEEPSAVHGVAKSWTRLSDFTFTFHFHALEKEMATHSSVLAWRIPGTGEPGGLPSMGSHGVGHNWSDLAAAAAAAVWSTSMGKWFLFSFVMNFLTAHSCNAVGPLWGFMCTNY